MNSSLRSPLIKLLIRILHVAPLAERHVTLSEPHLSYRVSLTGHSSLLQKRMNQREAKTKPQIKQQDELGEKK